MTEQATTETNGSGPQVTVIMPVLNARAFLAESIHSVLSQSFSQFELLIVDNGSSDGSREYAQSLSDKRVRVLNATQRGAAHAINAGIAAARADLLAIMDADDVSLPDRLGVQVAYMREHPECVLLGARFSFLIGKNLVPVAPPLMYHRQIRKALLQGNAVFSNGSTMFRAVAAKKVGGHCLNGPAHDFDFFLRMSEIGIVHNLHETLYHYRLHEGASTASTNPFMREQITFAVACARAREAGIPEPAFGDFRREWSTRSRRAKLTDRATEISNRLYRDGVVQLADRNLVSAGLAIFGSAVLNPSKVIYRVQRRLHSADDQIALESHG
jgi:glycosyltransferase involved in cell wall biosynthesis